MEKHFEPMVEAKPIDPNVRAVDVPRLTGQNAQIVCLMKQRGSIDARDAQAIGVWRLAARIGDIRGAGYVIESKINETTKLAVYSLVSEPQQKGAA